MPWREKEEYGWIWHMLFLPENEIALEDVSVALKRQGGSLKGLPL